MENRRDRVLTGQLPSPFAAQSLFLTLQLSVEDERHRVSHPNKPKMNRFATMAAAVLICAVGFYCIWRSSQPQVPLFVAKTGAPSARAEWHDGAWYWLEGAGTPAARVMRGDNSAPTVAVSASLITSYAIGPGKIATIAGMGNKWSISLANTAGGGSSTVWSGDREPRGLYFSDQRLYWLDQAPPAVPNADAFSPLAPSVRVMVMPMAGGAPTLVGSVMEIQGGRILGVKDGQITLTATRSGLQDVTTIYRIPIAGGVARRIAAETGQQQAVLSRDGVLYWTGPSREAAQPTRVVCVRRLGRDGRTEWLQDWLPYGGALYESGDSVYYVGGSGIPGVWPIGGANPLPQPAKLPTGYTALAVGNGGILLQSDSEKIPTLYRISL